MKPVKIWVDKSTGKLWHKDLETEVTTEITSLPATPTAADIKARMEEMGLRLR